MSSPGSDVTNVAMAERVRRADQADCLGHFFGRAVHQVIETDGVDAELLGHVNHLVQGVQTLVRHGRVDADAQRRMLPAGGFLQATKARARTLEGPLQAASGVVQLAWTVDRHADVLEKTCCGQVG